MASDAAAGAGDRPRNEQQQWLSRLSDSGLERQFVDWLAVGGYRIPDDAQLTITEARARPDFVYRLPGNPVAVFVDGPHHDQLHHQARDADAEERLSDAGWTVVRVRHNEDWPAVATRHSWLFGPGRAR